MLLLPYLRKTKLKDQNGVSKTEGVRTSARSPLPPEERSHGGAANGGVGFPFPTTPPDSESQPGFPQLKQSRQPGHFRFLQHFAVAAGACQEQSISQARLRGTWLCEGDSAHAAAAAWPWCSTLPAQALLGHRRETGPVSE